LVNSSTHLDSDGEDDQEDDVSASGVVRIDCRVLSDMHGSSRSTIVLPDVAEQQENYYEPKTYYNNFRTLILETKFKNSKVKINLNKEVAETTTSTMTTSSAVKQRIRYPILPPHRPIDGAEDPLTVVPSIDRKVFGCCVPFGMPKGNHCVDEKHKVVKIFPRKHLKFLQRVLFQENNTVKYYNHVFYLDPTMLNYTSRMYSANVPEVYTVLQFLHKPWDVGEYHKNRSLYRVLDNSILVKINS
jgi:hypothetical protein